MCLRAQEGLGESGKISGLDGWVSTLEEIILNGWDLTGYIWEEIVVILIGYLEGMVFGQMNEIGVSHFYFVKSFDLQLGYAHWERGEQQLIFTSESLLFTKMYRLLICKDSKVIQKVRLRVQHKLLIMNVSH